MTWGGALRWLASGEHFGLTAGLEGSYPAVVKVQEYELSLARISIDTSASLCWRWSTAELGIALGPMGLCCLPRARSVSKCEIHAHGRRRAPWVSRSNHRSMGVAFLALQAELSARRFSLMVDPIGNVALAPRVCWAC